MSTVGFPGSQDGRWRRGSDAQPATWQARWFVATGLGVVGAALCVVLPADSPPRAFAFYGTAALAVTALVLAASRMRPGARVIWWAITAFALLTAMAGLMFRLEADDVSSSLTGIDQALFALAYAPIVVALGLLVRGVHPGRDREAWIDWAIISVAASAIVGALVIAPLLSDDHLFGLGLVAGIGHPLLDLLVLCGLVWLIASGGRANAALMLLAAAFASLLSADIVVDGSLDFGPGDRTRQWVDALRILGLVLIAASAWAPDAGWMAAPDPRRRSRSAAARILALAVGVLAVPILVAVRVVSDDDRLTLVLVVAAIVIIVLTIWRMAVLVGMLEGQRALNQLVLDSAGDGIVGLDSAGRVLFVNLSARQLLQFREADLVGRRFHDLVHHHRPDGSPYPWEDCPVSILGRTGERGTVSDQVYFRRDGSTFPVEILVSPLLVDGVRTGVVSSFRDLSDRLALEKSRRQFISVVSHELRTPLTSIKGSLQMLDSGMFGPLADQQQELVTMAVSNSDRLGRLVNDILDLERLDAGRMTLHPQQVSGVEIARQAVHGITGAAASAGVSVGVVGPEAEDDVVVLADPHRLVQVLTNLLGNAVKFSPRDTVVTVTVSRDGEWVRIAVADQGRGIPAEHLATVFERFGQVESGDARQQGGTGLGLAIAKEITERSGGTVEVRSRPGEGSVFTVILPFASEVPAA